MTSRSDRNVTVVLRRDYIRSITFSVPL